MNILPVEIYQEIFKNLKYFKLVEFSLVNKIFHLEIKRILNLRSKYIIDSENELINWNGFDIPVANCHNLSVNNKFLYLFQNQIKNIPNSIGNLINLRELFLNNNQIKNIPDSIEKLINLKILSLSDNQIKTMPDSIKNLKNLLIFN